VRCTCDSTTDRDNSMQETYSRRPLMPRRVESTYAAKGQWQARLLSSLGLQAVHAGCKQLSQPLAGQLGKPLQCSDKMHLQQHASMMSAGLLSGRDVPHHISIVTRLQNFYNRQLHSL
jgi:hypothetical protein